jgi:hypothetical protein
MQRRLAKIGLGLVLGLLACNVTLAQDVTTNSCLEQTSAHSTLINGLPLTAQPSPTRFSMLRSRRPSILSWPPKASPRPTAKRPTSLSAIRSPLIKKGSGTLTAWAAGWQRRQVPPSTNQIVWTGRVTTRSRRQSANESEEPRQGYGEAVEGLPAQTEIALGKPSELQEEHTYDNQRNRHT